MVGQFKLQECKQRDYSRRSLVTTAQPTLSQLWSFKVRHATVPSYIKFADLLILKHLNCERAGQECSLSRKGALVARVKQQQQVNSSTYKRSVDILCTELSGFKEKRKGKRGRKKRVWRWRRERERGKKGKKKKEKKVLPLPQRLCLLAARLVEK